MINNYKFKEKLLTKDEEYKLISNWQKNKNNKSLDKLIKAYKKLVVSFAKKYFSYGLPQEDLIQEGMMGLMYGIEKFDISRGFRLSTYANWWIKAMMQDYILKNWSIVKSGSTASQKILFFSFNKVKKLINFDSLNTMDIEQVEKISKTLKMKTLDIENLQTRLKMGDQSLNKTIAEDNASVELISLLKDDSPTQDDIFQNLNDTQLKQKWIFQSINALNEREQFREHHEFKQGSREEMKQQRKIFVEGAIKNKVDKAQAESIFDLMEKFAGYGFNKSHSVAYALIAYQTAFLKTHYKEPFIAAVLSSDMDNTDKVVRFVKECENMSINLISPNINKSNYAFTVTEKNEIVYGLGAIKGVGNAIIDIILNERNLNGEYKSLDDLLKRCGTNKINKRVIEALIKSGSFDTFGDARSSLMSIYPESMKMADQNSKNIQQGQIDIFGFSEDDEKKKNIETVIEWSTMKKLSYERDVLGFYLSGHPINEYKNELKNIISNNLYSIKKNYSKNGSGKNTLYKIAGVINNMRIRTTSTKDKLAQINLGDDTDNIDVIANNSILDNSINRDEIVIIEGTIRLDEYTNRLSFRAKSIDSIDNARIKFATGVKIKVINESDLSILVGKLESFFKNSMKSGKCFVRIDYISSNVTKSLVLGEKYKIFPTSDTIGQLEKLDCVKDIELIYSKM